MVCRAVTPDLANDRPLDRAADLCRQMLCKLSGQRQLVRACTETGDSGFAKDEKLCRVAFARTAGGRAGRVGQHADLPARVLAL